MICLHAVRLPSQMHWYNSSPTGLSKVITAGCPGRGVGAASAVFHNAVTEWLCVNPAA